MTDNRLKKLLDQVPACPEHGEAIQFGSRTMCTGLDDLCHTGPSDSSSITANDHSHHSPIPGAKGSGEQSETILTAVGRSDHNLAAHHLKRQVCAGIVFPSAVVPVLVEALAAVGRAPK